MSLFSLYGCIKWQLCAILGTQYKVYVEKEPFGTITLRAGFVGKIFTFYNPSDTKVKVLTMENKVFRQLALTSSADFIGVQMTALLEHLNLTGMHSAKTSEQALFASSLLLRLLPLAQYLSFCSHNSNF